jgi:hypothetical protein
VYALNGVVQARGGGYDPDETSVTGQIIASSVLGNGNGSFKVVYNENDTYIKPPSISMDK